MDLSEEGFLLLKLFFAFTIITIKMKLAYFQASTIQVVCTMPHTLSPLIRLYQYESLLDRTLPPPRGGVVSTV